MVGNGEVWLVAPWESEERSKNPVSYLSDAWFPPGLVIPI